MSCLTSSVFSYTYTAGHECESIRTVASLDTAGRLPTYRGLDLRNASFVLIVRGAEESRTCVTRDAG